MIKLNKVNKFIYYYNCCYHIIIKEKVHVKIKTNNYFVQPYMKLQVNQKFCEMFSDCIPLNSTRRNASFWCIFFAEMAQFCHKRDIVWHWASSLVPTKLLQGFKHETEKESESLWFIYLTNCKQVHSDSLYSVSKKSISKKFSKIHYIG